MDLRSRSSSLRPQPTPVRRARRETGRAARCRTRRERLEKSHSKGNTPTKTRQSFVAGQNQGPPDVEPTRTLLDVASQVSQTSIPSSALPDPLGDETIHSPQEVPPALPSGHSDGASTTNVPSTGTQTRECERQEARSRDSPAQEAAANGVIDMDVTPSSQTAEEMLPDWPSNLFDPPESEPPPSRCSDECFWSPTSTLDQSDELAFPGNGAESFALGHDIEWTDLERSVQWAILLTLTDYCSFPDAVTNLYLSASHIYDFILQYSSNWMAMLTFYKDRDETSLEEMAELQRQDAIRTGIDWEMSPAEFFCMTRRPRLPTDSISASQLEKGIGFLKGTLVATHALFEDICEAVRSYMGSTAVFYPIPIDEKAWHWTHFSFCQRRALDDQIKAYKNSDEFKLASRHVPSPGLIRAKRDQFPLLKLGDFQADEDWLGGFPVKSTHAFWQKEPPMAFGSRMTDEAKAFYVAIGRFASHTDEVPFVPPNQLVGIRDLYGPRNALLAPPPISSRERNAVDGLRETVLHFGDASRNIVNEVNPAGNPHPAPVRSGLNGDVSAVESGPVRSLPSTAVQPMQSSTAAGFPAAQPAATSQAIVNRTGQSSFNYASRIPQASRGSSYVQGMMPGAVLPHQPLHPTMPQPETAPGTRNRKGLALDHNGFPVGVIISSSAPSRTNGFPPQAAAQPAPTTLSSAHASEPNGKGKEVAGTQCAPSSSSSGLPGTSSRDTEEQAVSHMQLGGPSVGGNGGPP